MKGRSIAYRRYSWCIVAQQYFELLVMRDFLGGGFICLAM